MKVANYSRSIQMLQHPPRIYKEGARGQGGGQETGKRRREKDWNKQGHRVDKAGQRMEEEWKKGEEEWKKTSFRGKTREKEADSSPNYPRGPSHLIDDLMVGAE